MSVPLPQLLSGGKSSNYDPNSFDYVPKAELEAAGRPIFPSLEDWMKIFYDSIASFSRTAAADSAVEDAAAKAEDFAAAYRKMLDDLNENPSGSEISCLELCRLR